MHFFISGKNLFLGQLFDFECETCVCVRACMRAWVRACVGLPVNGSVHVAGAGGVLDADDGPAAAAAEL